MARVAAIVDPVRRAALRRAGQAYLAGESLADAVAVAEARRAEGAGVTLCYWNAATDSPAQVGAMAAAAVAAAAERSAWCDISVKVPALGFDRELTGRLAEQCSQHGVRLWLDSHDAGAADRTFELAVASARLGCDVGVAIPARWRRSVRDVDSAVEAGLAVRIVKGQWPDPEGPVDDVRQNALSLLDRLAGHRRTVAVASHDDQLVEAALRSLCGSGSPVEVQLLHSLPLRGVLALAGRYGAPVRFYVPFGHPSLGYSVRSMWENRRVAGWFARDLLLGGAKPAVPGRPRRGG